MLEIYKLFIGSKPSFLRSFEGEEALYQQATIFWNKLDSAAFWLPIIVLVVGGGLAAYYYSLFNNKPGRRYHPKWWYGMMVACAVVSSFLSFILPMCLVGNSFNGSLGLEIKLAFGNKGEFISQYPDKNNHAIDAVRYGMEAEMLDDVFSFD